VLFTHRYHVQENGNIQKRQATEALHADFVLGEAHIRVLHKNGSLWDLGLVWGRLLVALWFFGLDVLGRIHTCVTQTVVFVLMLDAVRAPAVVVVIQAKQFDGPIDTEHAQKIK